MVVDGVVSNWVQYDGKDQTSGWVLLGGNASCTKDMWKGYDALYPQKYSIGTIPSNMSQFNCASFDSEPPKTSQQTCIRLADKTPFCVPSDLSSVVCKTLISFGGQAACSEGDCETSIETYIGVGLMIVLFFICCCIILS